MDFWAIILLAINISFMGGILYIFRKKKTGLAKKLIMRPDTGSDPLTDELKRGLREVKLLTAGLNRQRLELEDYERVVKESQRRLESIIKEAEAAGRKLDLMQSERRDESYSRAMGLIKNGVPADEVTSRLGLLNGEMELITALSSIKM